MAEWVSRVSATSTFAGDLAISELRELEALSRTLVLGFQEGPPQPESPGQPVYLVVSGSLLLSCSLPESGSLRLGPGDIFSLTCPGLQTVSTSLVAVETTELAAIAWPAIPITLAHRIRSEVIRHWLQVHLVSVPLFYDLNGTELSQIGAGSQFVSVPRGERLIQEGGAPDCLYVIVRGSLEVFREGREQNAEVIDFLNEGSCVGEMAVLLDQPRSASVRARRDSLLIQVDGQCFSRILPQNPHVTLRLARTLSERLKRTTVLARHAATTRIIALLNWSGALSRSEPDIFSEFHEQLAAAFARAGCRRRTLFPPSEPEHYAEVLNREESLHDTVLCVCGPHSPEWTAWAVGQADVILCFGSRNAPLPGRLPKEIGEAQKKGARLELALVRGATQSPEGTAKWLGQAAFDAHHHLIQNDTADFDKLVRRLSGKAWGLVLSGGGARGLAHIGVIEALLKTGFPIDMIGGTSMGAIIAAQYAMGCNTTRMLAMTRRAYTGGGAFQDLTLPFVSIRTGRGTMKRLTEMFGDSQIEDLPTAYFSVSCNLTQATTVIHDRGSLAMAARISCSVPGLLPPVPWNGDILVDGGLLDNLPVDAMRRKLRGFVAGSDVSVPVDLAVDSRLPSETSWSGISQLIRKFAGRPRLPTIGELLMRMAEIGSVRDSRLAGSPADLYLPVPVDAFSMSDFQAIDRIVAAGYEYTAQRLAAWEPGRPDWEAGQRK